MGPDLIPGDVKLSPGLREHLAFLFYATLSRQGWEQDLSLWRHLPLPWTPPLLHTGAAGSFTSPGGGSDQQGDYLGRALNTKGSLENPLDSKGMLTIKVCNANLFQLMDHNDLYVLDLTPSLKTLAMMVVNRHGLSTEVLTYFSSLHL